MKTSKHHTIVELTVLLSIIVLSSQEQQHFIVVPVNTTTITGDESAQFNCTVGNKNDVLYWKFNGHVKTNDGTSYEPNKYSVVGNSSQGEFNLEVLHVTYDDRGKYECIVLGTPRLQSVAYLKVEVPYPPRNIHIIVNQLRITEGVNFTITCQADAIPAATYVWTKNGSLLTDKKRYMFNYDGSELLITGILRSESDYYNCTAINDHGQDTLAKFIDVFYLPNGSWPTCELNVQTRYNYYAEGDMATLICQATGGNPAPLLRWYNGSTPLPLCSHNRDDNPTVTKTSFCWTLTSYDNDKLYNCDGVHIATSDTFRCNTDVLDIKYSPLSQSCSQANATTEGEIVTLICESDGNPLSTLQWINETSQQILRQTENPYSGDMAINAHSWKLQREDNQVSFRCDAFNNVTGNKLNCSSGPLTVYFPALTVSLTGYTEALKKGDYLKLLCLTDSCNPSSSVHWYKNDNLISEDINEEIQYEKTTNASFHGYVTEGCLGINITASHNGNIFHCMAKRYGYDTNTISNSYTFNVYFKPAEPDGCITNITGHSGPLLEENDVLLTCTSCSSNPQASIEWIRDDSQVYSELNKYSYLDGIYGGWKTSQELTIHLTYKNHGQRYRCAAFNDEFHAVEDRVLSEEIILNVNYSPFVENEEANAEQAVNLTENGNLLCEINSNPSADVTWFDNKHNTISNNTDKHLIREATSNMIKTSTLTIYNVTEYDYGDYICRAVNYLSDVNFTINLLRKGRPYPAIDVFVQSKSEDNLTLTWTPDLGGGIDQNFYLKYRENVATGNEIMETEPTKNTTETISDLLAMTEYYIIVVSFNAVSKSESEPVIESTLPPKLLTSDITVPKHGTVTILVPNDACLKVQSYNGIHWLDYVIKDPCEEEVTLKLEGSGELLIYSCTDANYTLCGESYYYMYTFDTPNEWSFVASILLVLIVVTLSVLVVLSILIWRNAKKTKSSGPTVREGSSIRNDYYEHTKVETCFLSDHQEQSKIDAGFSSIVNLPMNTGENGGVNDIDVDGDKYRPTLNYSNVKTTNKRKPEEKHTSSLPTQYAVNGPITPATNTDPGNDGKCAQYAVINAKEKKEKNIPKRTQRGNIDKEDNAVYADVNKKPQKDKKSKGKAQHPTPSGNSSDDAADTPHFMKGTDKECEYMYANVSGLKSGSKTHTKKAPDGATDDANVKKMGKTSRDKKSVKTLPTTEKVYDDVHEEVDKKSHTKGNENKKTTDAEGLVYADLDLANSGNRRPFAEVGQARPVKKPVVDSTEYADIDFSKMK